jgi:cytochrome c
MYAPRLPVACCLVIAALLGMGGSGVAHASAELAKKKYCMNCHGLGGTIVGPGFRNIARQRGAESDAVAVMAERIRQGSVGVWGSKPMPANAVTPQEAETLARWILSLAQP